MIQTKALSEVAEVIMGQSPPGETYNNEALGVPLLNGPTEFGSRHPSPVMWTSCPTKTSAPNDILFCVRGSTTGRMNWADQSYCLGRGLAAIRSRSGYLDAVYIYHILRFSLSKLLSNTSGSVFPNISRHDLSEFRLPWLLDDERAYASSLLSSLDDKIELNRQMNKTLEEMAQAIFKEWFVDFGPFRDGGMQDTELGPIPVGWRVEPIGSVAKINARVRRKDYQHQLIQYIDISSVNQGHLENTTPYKLSEAPSRAQRLVADQDILWSCVRPNRRSYYYVLNPADNLVVSTGFAVLSPERVPGSYLYQWVTTDQFVEYLTANADGSAYPAVRADHFAKALCVVPPNDILADFDACVHPMRSNIAFNSLMNTSLAAIRDTLLPKLMSGEIRVPVTEESA